MLFLCATCKRVKDLSPALFGRGNYGKVNTLQVTLAVNIKCSMLAMIYQIIPKFVDFFMALAGLPHCWRFAGFPSGGQEVLAVKQHSTIFNIQLFCAKGGKLAIIHIHSVAFSLKMEGANQDVRYSKALPQALYFLLFNVFLLHLLGRFITPPTLTYETHEYLMVMNGWFRAASLAREIRPAPFFPPGIYFLPPQSFQGE